MGQRTSAQGPRQAVRPITLTCAVIEHLGSTIEGVNFSFLGSRPRHNRLYKDCLFALRTALVTSPRRATHFGHLPVSDPKFPDTRRLLHAEAHGRHRPLNNQYDTRHASLAETQPHQLCNRRWSVGRGLSGGAVCVGQDWGGQTAHERRPHRKGEVRIHTLLRKELLIVLVCDGDLNRTRKTAHSPFSPSCPPPPRTYSMPFPSNACWKSCRSKRQSACRAV